MVTTHVPKMRQKIVIAGGTGFLGSSILKRFEHEGYDLVVLTRQKSRQQGAVKYVQWNAQSLGPWTDELEGSTAVINLVGKSVNCRYTEANKKEIIASRVLATQVLGKAILCCLQAPKVWINASSAAIFGYSEEEIKNEDAAIGQGFSSEVCQYWEKAFNDISLPHTRKVILRIGVVLQADTGLLRPFLNLVRWGLGGNIGSGEQYMTWIHETDFLNLIDWVIKEEDAQGVFHASSPFPVKNKDFMKALRRTSPVPFGLPNPVWVIHLGAVLIGTEAELVLKGRRVVSKKLQEKGFIFKYPIIKNALEELLSKN